MWVCLPVETDDLTKGICVFDRARTTSLRWLVQSQWGRSLKVMVEQQEVLNMWESQLCMCLYGLPSENIFQ